MKYLFILLMVFTMKLALACNPGVYGTGPTGDPYCMGPIFEQERIRQQQQQQYYNNYNSGGTVYVKPDAWGAVVVGKDRPVIGMSRSEANEEEAIEAAQRDCGGEDCEVLLTYKNGYLAVVQGKLPNGRYRPYAWATSTVYGAKRKTFKLCEQHATECKLLSTDKSFF